MQNNLKKGMMEILLANIINMVFNLLTNFLLPKYLSVDSYAAIKTFQVYTTYVGIFALGYADGMYLRYGGKEIDKIDRKELKTGMVSFRTMMLIESAILIPLALLFRDRIIIAFAMTIMSANMASYFKNLYQAVGEFKSYSKILNLTTIFTFIANMALLFIVRTDDYFLYLISYVIVDTIIWFALEINISKILEGVEPGHVSIKLLWEDIKAGFLLMIGNFSNILLSSMDRWFVKVMMDSAQFAYYSFAVSMEGFLNVAITPITTTLYNYFCNHSEHDDVIRIRRYVMLFGTVIVAAAFPARFIIEILLQNYTGAINVLFILFGTQMVYIIIKGVYVNLYKAFKKQNLYFIRLILILIIGAILNWSFVQIYPYKEAFSYGTLVSAYIWLIFSIWDFKEYKFEFREWLYLFIEVTVFITCGILFNSITGLLIYVTASMLCMNLFMKEETKMALRLVKGNINRKK